MDIISVKNDENWNNWKWQIKNRILTIQELSKIIDLDDAEKEALKSNLLLPLAITPYYASLLDKKDTKQPLRKTVIPRVEENICSAGENKDPLDEDRYSPVPGIIHRYPDRVLFLVTNFCSTFCRYCTRSRIISKEEIYKNHWVSAIKYIKSNSSIRDVLISGGDPLTLSDTKLDWLLGELRNIPHIEFIRIGTKVPVVLPMRITDNLIRVLKRYHPLWITIHFTHPEEITPETSKACNALADAGIPLGSQTVLLKDVNDDVEILKNLFHKLLTIRVRPYYLYQCDPILGSSHFRTPIATGLNIISKLRGFTTGYAVPNYVIDAPGGGGKVLLLPKSILGKKDGYFMFKNYKGEVYRYPDF